MLIRSFEPGDAEALAVLFHASVRQAGIRHYSAEQVAAWSPSPPDEARYLQRARGRICLVATDDDGQPVGYGDLERDGHIDHLYCHPDRIGTGIGSSIYAAIEEAAIKAGITHLLVEASEGARCLFERRGFDVDARNDFMLHGVPIHNYRMSKSIDRHGAGKATSGDQTIMVDATNIRTGQCHCGAVRFEAALSDGFATIRRCTCSYCRMRGAVAVSAEMDGITFLQGEDSLTSYRFNTGSAQHFFCSRCGIYTHHQRRSNRRQYGVNVACLDGVSPFDFLEVPVVDGVNHPTDTGEPPRQAGTLRFIPA